MNFDFSSEEETKIASKKTGKLVINVENTKYPII